MGADRCLITIAFGRFDVVAASGARLAAWCSPPTASSRTVSPAWIVPVGERSIEQNGTSGAIRAEIHVRQIARCPPRHNERRSEEHGGSGVPEEAE